MPFWPQNWIFGRKILETINIGTRVISGNLETAQWKCEGGTQIRGIKFFTPEGGRPNYPPPDGVDQILLAQGGLEQNLQAEREEQTFCPKKGVDQIFQQERV